MGQLKSQIAWLLKGGTRTHSALSSYADDLRALQAKVARIDEEVHALRAAVQQAEHAESHTDLEVVALKQQLRAAVDDLGDRVGSITERLNSAT